MGIFSRLSKVLESNLNALVERAEDPAKLLEQAIDDMRKGRDEARAAIIEAKTQKRLLERRRDKALADAEGFERRAMTALRTGDEEVARKAVELKLAAEQRAQAEEAAVAEQDNQIEQLVTAERELDRRLSELPARRAALVARQAAAQARGARVGAASKAKNSVSSALDAFDRMEEKIIRAEVEAEVISEQQPPMLEIGPERTDADEALALLKARVQAQLPSGLDEDVPTAAVTEAADDPNPVEDNLAALKAKLQAEE